MFHAAALLKVVLWMQTVIRTAKTERQSSLRPGGDKLPVSLGLAGTVFVVFTYCLQNYFKPPARFQTFIAKRCI